MAQTGHNFDEAYKAQRKLVVRCFHRHSSETRSNLQASFRLGHRQREATGDFFYTHPAVPNRAFPTRKAAALAAMNA